MEDRAIALGGLVATPISIGIVAGAVLHHIGGGYCRPWGHHYLHPAHALLAQAGR